MTEQGKTCTKCDEWKTYSGFSFDKTSGRYRSDCKLCVAKGSKLRYQTNESYRQMQLAKGRKKS